MNEAIVQIRMQRITDSLEDKDNGCFSVESMNDVNTLIQYETFLRRKIKLLKEKISKDSEAPNTVQIGEKKGEPGLVNENTDSAPNKPNLELNFLTNLSAKQQTAPSESLLQSPTT